MISREDIIHMLKQIDIDNLKGDGPTSLFFRFEVEKKAKAFKISIKEEIVSVTTGNFLFKRKYTINKNEL